jgi:hypothetical protein
MWYFEKDHEKFMLLSFVNPQENIQTIDSDIKNLVIKNYIIAYYMSVWFQLLSDK